MELDNNINFTIDSKFLKELKTTHDEISIYKSNFVDFLLEQEDFRKSIQRKDDIPFLSGANQWWYLSELKSYAKQRSEVFVKGFASYVAEGVDGDGENIEINFNVINKGNDLINPKEKNKITSRHFFVLRFLKGRKVTLKINNMESVFLSESQSKSINTIDYSKTILQLDNFKFLEETIKETSADSYNKSPNNKKYGKNFKNLVASLRDTKIYNREEKNNDTVFSQTLGFSIKSLTFNDINEIEFLNKKNAKKETTSIRAVRENYLERYPKKLVNFINNTNNVKYNTFANGGKGGYQFNRANITIGETYLDEFEILDSTRLKYRSNYFQKDLFSKEIYTVCYFSLFKSKDKKTYFKKSVRSNHALEIIGENKSNIFKAKVLPNKSNFDYNFDVKFISEDDFKKSLNLIHRLDGGSIAANRQKDVINYNKILNTKKSNISSFFERFTLDSQNGILKITLDNIIILDSQTEIDFINKLIKNNVVNPENYHFFIPELFLETLTSRVLLDKKIKSIRDNIVATFPNGFNLNFGKVYDIEYSISIKDIYDNLRTTGKSSLRALTPYYGSKWFYTKDVEYKKDESFKNISYPAIETNISWEYAKPDDGEAEAKNDNYNPLIYVNGKLVEPSGGSQGKPSNSSTLEETKKEEVLQNNPENVLKITKEASSLEFKKLQGALEEAKSGEGSDASLGSILEEAENNKVVISTKSLILDFSKLNLVDKKNPRGKANDSELKFVSYAKGRRNLFKFRRSNVQPRLLDMINKAVEITKKKYPDLVKAEVMSLGSPPPDLSAFIFLQSSLYEDFSAEVKKAQTKVEFISKNIFSVLKQEFPELNKKDIDMIVNGFKKRGPDLNHMMGFAADVYLKRAVEGGKERHVCLYKPNDDNDFKITQLFLQVCKELGVTGIGAGLYYMDEPDFLRYKTKKEIAKLKKDKDTTKLGAAIESLYATYKIKAATEENDSNLNKIIIDDSGMPIRMNTRPANAFHLDIINSVSRQYFSSNEFSNAVFYSKAIFEGKDKNKMGKDAFKKYKKMIREYDINKDKKGIMSPHVNYRVWGSKDNYETADKWLLDIIGSSIKSRPTFSNVNEITTANYKKIAIDQFEPSHPSSKDSKSGKIITQFVSVDDLPKTKDSE